MLHAPASYRQLAFTAACMQEAVAAKQQTDKYQLDKSHVFSVHMLDDIDKYARTPDTYTPPEPKPFKAMVRRAPSPAT